MALTALSTVAFAAGANAQTVTVPVGATVANDITVAVNQNMEFGTLIAINEAANTAYIEIDTQDTLGTPVSTGGDAKVIAVTGTPTSAEVNLTGVNGADMELIINNVVNPVDQTVGTDSLTLSNFIYSFDGGTTETPATVGTVFTLTADGTTQLVEIGARLTTPASATQIADDTYAGSFDFVASY